MLPANFRQRGLLLAALVAIVGGSAATAEAANRRGAFSLINDSDVVIPFQLWDGVGWYDSDVAVNTILRININIYANGRSHHQPYIRFENSKGRVITYRLEFYEIYDDSEDGKVYQFEYDEQKGWDLHTTD